MVLLLTSPVPANAGECLDSPENYLTQLVNADINEEQGDIFCLYSDVVYFEMGYEHFASPTVINKIRNETESSKKQAVEVLPKFLKSTSSKNRCFAAEALAYYRWAPSYEYLADCDEDRPGRKAIVYAILGDKRAVPWVIQQYEKLDKKYQKKPKQSYSQKMDLLNSLYHLASSESLPFVEDVIANPKPKEVKARAIKVKKRILEHKDLMPN